MKGLNCNKGGDCSSAQRNAAKGVASRIFQQNGLESQSIGLKSWDEGKNGSTTYCMWTT